MIYARSAMSLSRASKALVDPPSDVLAVLDARATRRTRLEATGDWALAFPALDRLKFVAVLRGTCCVMFPGSVPQQVSAGDCCIIGRTAYSVASDPLLAPIDGLSLHEGSDVLRLGGDETVMLGGGLTLTRGNAHFLLDMLPAYICVPRASAAAGAVATALSVATALALLDREAEHPGIGSEIVTARLTDVLMIEAMRAYASSPEAAEIGWLGALADPRIGRALHLIHGDIAQPWTVARLASEVGMSRAAFSATFTHRVGQSPLAYVRAWRLTFARAALEDRRSDVATVAANVGYTSQSAFGHAFRRAFGVSPGANART
jgi:AraC-like DNA-binding protein